MLVFNVCCELCVRCAGRGCVFVCRVCCMVLICCVLCVLYVLYVWQMCRVGVLRAFCVDCVAMFVACVCLCVFRVVRVVL